MFIVIVMLITVSLFGAQYKKLNSGDTVRFELSTAFIMYVLAMFLACSATICAAFNVFGLTPSSDSKASANNAPYPPGQAPEEFAGPPPDAPQQEPVAY